MKAGEVKISAVATKEIVRFLWVIFFMLTPVLSFAQDTGPPPCNDSDPTTQDCPLDNWVWVLVALTIIAVTYQTLHKRKALNS